MKDPSKAHLIVGDDLRRLQDAASRAYHAALQTTDEAEQEAAKRLVLWLCEASHIVAVVDR